MNFRRRVLRRNQRRRKKTCRRTSNIFDAQQCLRSENSVVLLCQFENKKGQTETAKLPRHREAELRMANVDANCHPGNHRYLEVDFRANHLMDVDPVHPKVLRTCPKIKQNNSCNASSTYEVQKSPKRECFRCVVATEASYLATAPQNLVEDPIHNWSKAFVWFLVQSNHRSKLDNIWDAAHLLQTVAHDAKNHTMVAMTHGRYEAT